MQKTQADQALNLSFASWLPKLAKPRSMTQATEELKASLRAAEAAGRSLAALSPFSALLSEVGKWAQPEATLRASWQALMHLATSGLPEPVVLAAVTLLPKNQSRTDRLGASELSGLGMPRLRALVKAKRLSTGDIAKALREQVTQVSGGFLPDMLIELGQPIPKQSLHMIASGAARTDGSMTASELIAQTYSLDPAPESSKRLEHLISNHADLKAKVYQHVARDPIAAMRLTSWLTDPGVPKDRRKRRLMCQERLLEWASVLLERAEQQDGGAFTALAVLRSVAAQEPESAAAVVTRQLASRIESVTERRALRLLRHQSGVDSDVIALNARDLEVVLQEHALGSSELVGDRSADRDLRDRLIQEKALRTTLQDLAARAAALDPGGTARKELEAVLLNSGVQPFGVPGETLPFDGARHVASESAVAESQQVVVRAAGFEWREGETSRVLVRAVVSAAH